MTPTVRWFRNSHEHRNYWLRFGLMRLNRRGVIDYREAPIESCVDFGFDEDIVRHSHRHTSVIAVEIGKERIRCIVDSEDSFLCMGGLIGYSDRYFCAGYNSTFFKEKRFEPIYSWLKSHETSFYRQRAAEIVKTQGKFFDRVRPFVPIAPDLQLHNRPGALTQRFRNLHHKASSQVGIDKPWRFELADFEQRYRNLLALRSLPARYDVVLSDKLWGWPRHRLALHERLAQLAASGRDIHSRLNWAEASIWDGSDVAPIPEDGFPITCGTITNYEEMLASSRLAVFASGFHWGWRNIMTLSLMWGLPILSDRLLVEPWFSIDRFAIDWNDDPEWEGIGDLLDRRSSSERLAISSKNQSSFDNLLAPDKVAEYFLGASLS